MYSWYARCVIECVNSQSGKVKIFAYYLINKTTQTHQLDLAKTYIVFAGYHYYEPGSNTSFGFRGDAILISGGVKTELVKSNIWMTYSLTGDYLSLSHHASGAPCDIIIAVIE